MQNLIEKISQGHLPSIARAISMLENNDPRGQQILMGVWKNKKNALRLGITGPPGAGKSTLTGKLTRFLLNHFEKIAIIAVDPSSPFTGGAILGDRIRMSDLVTLDKVFIRSMATRGSLGGLAAKSNEVADLLEAAGFDLIIFETVGVGQTELDVAREADITLVILVPESGDGIQAMKAGLMEIADIFVVNKCDREGCHKLAMELEMMLKNRSQKSDWDIPVLKTVAHLNQGITELGESVLKFVDYASRNGIFEIRRTERIKNHLIDLLKETMFEKIKEQISRTELDHLINQLVNHTISYPEAVNLILKKSNPKI